MAFYCLVSGQVQGVGYRVWCQQHAVQLGLRGWVRNVSSGEVEAWIDGDDEAIKTFIFSLHKGSVFAKVEQVTTRFKEATDDLDGFEILETRFITNS